MAGALISADSYFAGTGWTQALSFDTATSSFSKLLPGTGANVEIGRGYYLHVPSDTFLASGGPPLSTLQSLAVTPAAPAVVVGGTQQFAATGTFSDASTGDIATTVTWTSSTTGVATTSSFGLATGVAKGTVTITATDPATGLSDTATLTVAIPTAVPSLSQWGLIGMAGLFAFLILVGLGMWNRAGNANN